MSSVDVLVVGAGPTGLMLAAELALAGTDVALLERRPGLERAGSRAGGLHSRTLEELDQRGIAERFVSQGKTYPVVHFRVPLQISDFPTRHNHVLGLKQPHIERILAGWVEELGVPIQHGREVCGFTQDESGVDAQLADGSSLRARYLAGCDGGRSLIRKAAGIGFPGWDATTSWLLAEVEWSQEPEWGFREDASGTHAIGKLEDGKRASIVLTEPRLRQGDPALDDVREALVAIYGTDFGIHSPGWISRFTDVTRQAAAYRDRRILLAGDAAHVHPPFGGQGLNIGVQDAVNLGWKLGQVASNQCPETLLDTYHAERHPVAARVMRNTMAQGALRRPDERTRALADYVSELLGMDEPRRRLVGEISGLDIRYELGHGHPLLGRRMPDIDVVVGGASRRFYTLLHEARPVLLNLGTSGATGAGRWSDRVRVVDGTCDGAWELPVLGAVTAPAAVLVRPDGYVAWVGDSSRAGLDDALGTWFGPPRSGPHANQS